MSMSCNTKGQELFQIKRLNWHDSQINTRHDPGVEREKLLLKTILGQLANLNMDYILNNMLAILSFLILKNKLWLCKNMSLFLGKTHWSIIAEESWCLKLTLKWFSKNNLYIVSLTHKYSKLWIYVKGIQEFVVLVLKLFCKFDIFFSKSEVKILKKYLKTHAINREKIFATHTIDRRLVSA